MSSNNKTSIVSLEIKDNDNAAKDKKRLVAVFSLADGKTKTVRFGMYKSAGTYADGAAESKRDAYIARHSKSGENWTRSGAMTAGFLSRWVLWHARKNNEIKNKLSNIIGINNIKVNFKRTPVK